MINNDLNVQNPSEEEPMILEIESTKTNNISNIQKQEASTSTAKVSKKRNSPSTLERISRDTPLKQTKLNVMTSSQKPKLG